MQPLGKYLAHELRGREAGQFAGERQHHEELDSQAFDQSNLPFQRRQQLGRPFRRDHSGGMRFERNSRGHGPQVSRPLHDTSQQFLVSQVDAVKVADSHHA